MFCATFEYFIILNRKHSTPILADSDSVDERNKSVVKF